MSSPACRPGIQLDSLIILINLINLIILNKIPRTNFQYLSLLFGIWCFFRSISIIRLIRIIFYPPGSPVDTPGMTHSSKNLNFLSILMFQEEYSQLKSEISELEEKFKDPKITDNLEQMRELSKRYGDAKEQFEIIEQYLNKSEELNNNKLLLQSENEEEMKTLLEEEIKSLEEEILSLERKIKFLLVPPDPNDSRNVILEMRAGAGGDEASLFASDLFRTYVIYSEEQGWKIEILSEHRNEIGGFKEITALITGKNVYRYLKNESGVHRVQRIPATEKNGRIHTSTITVAVLPEAEETEIEIKTEDLRIDVFRSSGPGGQSVNMTDSAVRLTHIPSGLVVSCQDQKSQHKNKEKAMKVLASRLLALEEEKKQKERESLRSGQVGTGDRSEKIRTYNYPQNRITDHRLKQSWYNLEEIMEGKMGEIIGKF